MINLQHLYVFSSYPNNIVIHSDLFYFQNMILLISAILLACCVSTNARYNDQFRAGANINNGVPSLSGSWTRTGSNWETSVHGSVSGNGNWGVGVSVGWRFKRGVGSVRVHILFTRLNMSSQYISYYNVIMLYCKQSY
jgi:hypothetical protein